ncbi:MAG: thioredoxin domain-containing protein [Herminiimonas sp.]|nr:thioredoxin domain-containing protein [Herminiimonas sp.]
MKKFEQATTGLSAREHESGNPHAALTLVEYGDFECLQCAQAALVTRVLIETFGDRMRFVYRHFPDSAVHPHAELAAEAAEAAAAQGKFWPMHTLLFRHPVHLSADVLTRHAEEIELDMPRFTAELRDHVYLQRIREHHNSGVQLGLRGTPSFFLNNVPVDVSVGLDKLEHAVRAALHEK